MQNYYLGIDISKGYADFVILDGKKRPVEENFQMDDTFDGHCRLYERLGIFCNDHPESTIYAGVESTGGYENNWFNSLVKFQGTLNIKTAHLNPLGVNANSKADLKRNVTDKISAQNVAEYIIAHPEKISYQKQDHLASLRKQWSFIKMLVKQKTQLLNQLESNLYSANLEILVYCKNGVPDWVLTLLLRYPTASKLSKARKSSVASIPYISSQKAEELIETAKKSVSSSHDDVTEQIIQATVKQIKQIAQTIKAQTKIMVEKHSVPEVDLLKTFNGIGDLSAIGLILEIVSVERFASSKKLASFFGLHPVYKRSGDGSWGFRMSKKGRRVPRQILYMVTMAAINTNPLIREIYLKHTQQGMEKMAAIGVCMHKILRIIYGMLKHKKAFEPEIDRKNREKTYQCMPRGHKDKNRRYQEFDSKAPVSRRQSMKRKEQEQSQSNNDTMNGIEAPIPISLQQNINPVSVPYRNVKEQS